MDKIIIQTHSRSEGYFHIAEPLLHSKGTQKPRITFLGLDEKTKLHCAIAMSSLPSPNKPVLHFWEKGRWGVLEVYTEDGTKLFVKVNFASLGKRFDIDQNKVKEHAANNQGDVTGLVTDLVEQKYNPKTLEKQGSQYKSEKNFALAASFFETSSRLGNPKSFYHLGECYRKGEGVEKDPKKALECYEQAVKLAGNKPYSFLGLCYRKLGDYYQNGEDCEKDHTKAIDFYERAAKFGNPNTEGFILSCKILGFNNLLDEKDFTKAKEFFKKAVKAGDIKSLISLGVCYERLGDRLENVKKANKFFLMAAEHKLPQSERALMVSYLLLANIYRRAAADKKNAKEMVKYYNLAADLGAPIAASILGSLYENGHFVKKDLTKAADYYKRAATLGDILAIDRLGVCYLEGWSGEKDSQKAVDCFKRAIALGFIPSLLNLGICIEKGEGDEKDPRKAIDCYERALKDGKESHRDFAKYRLGLCYQDGFGVEKDLKKAQELYEASNLPEAKKALQKLEAKKKSWFSWR